MITNLVNSAGAALILAMTAGSVWAACRPADKPLPTWRRHPKKETR